MREINSEFSKDFNFKLIELHDLNPKVRLSTSATITSPESKILSELKLEEEKVSFSFLLMNLIPNAGSAMIGIMSSAAEVHFIGKTKDNLLYDGVGLGIVYVTCLFYYLGCGFSEALAILCPKSYGSRNFKLLGIQTNS